MADTTFPYKGNTRTLVTFDDASKRTTYYGYVASTTEAARIEKKYGAAYITSSTNGKPIVIIGGYKDNTKNIYDILPPGFDLDKLNGVTNEIVSYDIQLNSSFFKKATGNSSPNTSQDSGPGGTSTPAPSPAPSPGSGVTDTILTYPDKMDSSQDRILFTIFELAKPDFSPGAKQLTLEKRGFSKGLQPVNGQPVVCLPIQPSISDSNGVEWGSGTINQIQKEGVNLSLDAMNDTNLGQVPTALKDIYNRVGGAPALRGLAQLYFAEQAVGVQGLLSRATGQVLNPNLELLFNGPALRSFNFGFKLSPRSGEEAIKVKKIINFFKKNMAVRVVDGDIFIKSPYVFQIKYQKGTSDHQSINLIKTCALQSCSVDYTPLNSYMTYEDDAATMVSYNISLQFQEIEPVYADDYDDKHPIGY
jgi:hypothetical protein